MTLPRKRKKNNKRKRNLGAIEANRMLLKLIRTLYIIIQYQAAPNTALSGPQYWKDKLAQTKSQENTAP